MKKISILVLAIAAISAFSFVSFTSVNTKTDVRDLGKITALKGEEKSGVAQSNQNW